MKTAPVTPIRPALAITHITRWRCLLDPIGELVSTTWEMLFGELSRVAPFRGDSEHPGWSAAVFEGDQRAKAGVLQVTAAVLDYDGTASIARALETWAGHLGLLHTTRKHRDEAPRFRVVLPLRRPVSAFEWDHMWQRLQEHCDGASDPAAKDASRFWYVPGIVDGGEFASKRLDGAALDPDVWLRKPLKAQPSRPTTAPVRRAPMTREAMNALDRARRYIAKMPEAISGAKGHTACFNAARKLADFGLSEEDVYRVLRDDYNSRCEPAWNDKELRHKAAQAMDRTIVHRFEERNYESTVTPAPAPVNEDGEVLEDWDEPLPDLVDPMAEDETESATPRTMAELLNGVLEKAQSGLKDVGVDACHGKLHRLLAGFRPKMITVLGARTSFGKSSYAIMVADEAMRRGDGVLLVSAEDGEETYGQRFMARRARVNAFNLRANNCKAPELERMGKWAARAETVPFFVDAVGKPAEWIARTIREQCEAREVKLVIIDYVQRIGTTKRTQDKRTEITHAVSIISDAVKEAKAAGLFLSQLKRLDGNQTREPTMHDLKESGDIENMAEHVVLGWVIEESNGHDNAPRRSRFLKMEKNKDGPVDTRAMPIPFDEATASFAIEPDDDPPPEEFDEHFEDPTATRYR
jgi:replicative DNA helicase